MCCLNMGLNLKVLKMSPALLYGKPCEQTDHFANVFVCENVACGYDIVTGLCHSKNTADAILFREIQCKKMNNLMF